jgi:hypothetical protein
MILTHLNYLAVIVSTIAYFGIGAVWFSPALFANTWMKGHGISMPTDEETKKKMRAEMPKYMLINLIACFIGTLCIGYLEVAGCIFTWCGGAKFGLIGGVLICIAIGLSHMYTKKGFKTFMIDAGYHTVSLVIVGIIMAVWK